MLISLELKFCRFLNSSLNLWDFALSWEAKLLKDAYMVDFVYPKGSKCTRKTAIGAETVLLNDDLVWKIDTI